MGEGLKMEVWSDLGEETLETWDNLRVPNKSVYVILRIFKRNDFVALFEELFSFPFLKKKNK